MTTQLHILLVSSGLFHPPFLGRWLLHRALFELDGYDYRVIHSLERLPTDLNSFSALVLYYHHNQISDLALRSLDKYVHRGGGLLALHSATASFKQTRAYFKILGGRFVGHGAVEPYEVRPVPLTSIFNGIPKFTVKDELYLHECQPEIEVQFTACHQGQVVPVVWTYRYGRGRVCYCSPGHRAATLRDPVYLQVLQRGLAWAAQG